MGREDLAVLFAQLGGRELFVAVDFLTDDIQGGPESGDFRFHRRHAHKPVRNAKILGTQHERRSADDAGGNRNSTFDEHVRLPMAPREESVRGGSENVRWQMSWPRRDGG